MKLTDWLRSIGERFDRGINRDESVVFYPAYGFKEADGTWKLEIRGTIFEEGSVLKYVPELALRLSGVPSMERLEEQLEGLAEDIDAVRCFRERSRAFLVDRESNEEFQIDLCGQTTTIGKSNSFGYFDQLVTLPADCVESFSRAGERPWMSFVAADNDQERFFTGKFQILQPSGITVVSDIDDTIKDSNVSEPLQLVLNTLFRPFRLIEGMKAVYQEWHSRGASFIYLTNSPYELYEPLANFLQASFPNGPYCMRPIDWKTIKRSVDRLIAVDEEEGTKENPKKHHLIPLLERFPEQKFLLVGDSTEKDAEIYADLYLGRNFPDRFEPKPYGDRIAKIYIRDVPNSKRRKEAMTALEMIKPKDGENIAVLFDHPEAILKDARSVFEN